MEVSTAVNSSSAQMRVGDENLLAEPKKLINNIGGGVVNRGANNYTNNCHSYDSATITNSTTTTAPTAAEPSRAPNTTPTTKSNDVPSNGNNTTAAADKQASSLVTNGETDEQINEGVERIVEELVNNVVDRFLLSSGDEQVVEQQTTPVTETITTIELIAEHSSANSRLVASENQSEGKQTAEEDVEMEQNRLDIVSESGKLVMDHDQDDDLDETKETKEMVVLRNLEFTPPPQPVAQEETSPKMETDLEGKQDDSSSVARETRRTSKRKHETILVTLDDEINESKDSNNTETLTRSTKRKRVPTKLFQVGEVAAQSPNTSTTSNKSKSTTRPSVARRSRKKSTNSSSASASDAQESFTEQQPPPQQHNQSIGTDQVCDIPIFYEKNDYLAIRNEFDTFYLCQLTETIRVNKPKVKVRWLDTKDNGKTYYLTKQYDGVPQKSIIMPVMLNKLKSETKGEQLFSLDDSDRDNIEERLKRSLNAPLEGSSSSSQELSIDD